VRTAALALALLASGCVSAQQTARHSLAVAAVALRETDELLAPRYATASSEALGSSQTRAEYDAAMRPWDAAESAERAALLALLSLESLADAWTDAGRGFLAAAPCGLQTLSRLAEALAVVGVGLGPLSGALSALSSYAGTCHDAD
jgi:hypothetical protein